MTYLYYHKLYIRLCIFFLILGASFLYAENLQAASLSISPQTGVYSVGSTFSARILVNTSGGSVNAAEGTLSFNPKELSVVSIGKGSSIFNLWTIEPSFSNTKGTVTFGGGSPSGYTGSSGVILSVTFKVLAQGTPKVSFSQGSVLAADGRGTNVLSNMQGGTYTTSASASSPEAEAVIEYVAPKNAPLQPEVKSTTHPDETLWYQNTKAELAWDVGSSISAVRILVDTNPTSVPTIVYEPPIAGKTIDELRNGTSFVHVQFKNSDGWGKIRHYKLNVDTERPTALNVETASSSNSYNPVQSLQITLTDEHSGAGSYVIQIDGDKVVTFDAKENAVYELPRLNPGYHTIVVEGKDKAGNSITASHAFTIEAFEAPRFTDFAPSISDDIIPVFKGITRPHARVEVTIARALSVDEAIASAETVTADSEGVFIFIPEGALSLGVYDVTAVAIDSETGATSEVSSPVRFVVERPGYLKIGALVVSVLSVLVPLVALVIVLCFILVIGLHRARALRLKIRKEVHDVEKGVSQEFEHIAEALRTHIRELKVARKGRLTAAEESFIHGVASVIERAESNLEKEVKDVERLTG